MGKHAKEGRYPRLWTFLKFSILGVVLLSVGMLVGGYGYLKYIENRLHKDNKEFKKLKKVISKPLPKESVNFLLVGSDARRKGEKARSDTLILAKVDSQEKKVVFLFIPRDFRVKIPGMGYNKINAAYAYGGPELAVRTVEDYTQFDIHHYVEIDFRGFKKMVDALGGVEIEVEQPIIDKSKMYRMYIPAGKQRFNGETALNYVRYRHDPKGDFGRIERQQKFLKALSDQVFRFRNLLRWPKIINIFAENTRTDLSTADMLKFVNLYRSLGENNLEMVMLPGKPGGAKGVSYVLPDEEKVKEILVAVKEGLPLTEFKEGATVDIPKKSIRVEVLNGTGERGLAEEVKSKLLDLGFSVVATANANHFKYKKSKVLYDSASDYQKAIQVSKFFKGESLEYSQENLEKGVDVLVIVGKNYPYKGKK